MQDRAYETELTAGEETRPAAEGGHEQTGVATSDNARAASGATGVKGRAENVQADDAAAPDGAGGATAEGVAAVDGTPAKPVPNAPGSATAATSTSDDITTRLRPIFTQEGLDALASSRVLVFGLGGVGSSCVEALARATVGELFLVDRDTVDKSNLNRQALAFECTVGRVKAEVMTEMVAQINPRCHVEARQCYVSADNLPEILAWAGAEVDEAGNVVGRGQISYVVDAIDTITQKLALAKLCWDANIPEISSMGAANRLDPTQFQIADVRKSHGCRMARTIRKECLRRRIPHLQVLFSPEKPVRPSAVAGSSHGGLPNLGTASYMPPIMGQMVAGRVIRALIGYEPWPWDRAGEDNGD